MPASLGKICLGKVCPLCAFKFAPRFGMQINVIKYSPSALAAIETALSIIQNRCACTIYETRAAAANASDILDQVDIIRMSLDDMQAKSLLQNSPGATSDRGLINASKLADDVVAAWTADPLSDGLRPML